MSVNPTGWEKPIISHWTATAHGPLESAEKGHTSLSLTRQVLFFSSPACIRKIRERVNSIEMLFH